MAEWEQVAFAEIRALRDVTDQRLRGIEGQTAAIAEGLREQEQEVDKLELGTTQQLHQIWLKIGTMDLVLKFILALTVFNIILTLWFRL